MARSVQFIRLDGSGLFRVSAIERVVPLEDAVVVRDHKGKLLAWVKVYTKEQSDRVVEILEEIVNNPTRAQQPDLSFIVAPTEEAPVASDAVTARSATMPKRNNGSPPAVALSST